MKKNGFTLTEALLALAIIGIVAALTIPSVTLEHRKRTYGASLAAAVSDFETAMSFLIMRDGVDNLLETRAWKVADEEGEISSGSIDENVEKFVNNLNKTLRIDSYYNNYKDYYKDAKINLLNGSEYNPATDNYSNFSQSIIITSKNTAYSLCMLSNTGDIGARNYQTEKDILNAGGNLYLSAMDVTIDVNGLDKPNTFGRDIFHYKLGIDGKLYPIGGKDYSIWANNWNNTCESSNDDGYHCAGRLAENNYKMDY